MNPANQSINQSKKFLVFKNEPEANLRPEAAEERCFIQEVKVQSVHSYGKHSVMC